MIRFYHKIAIFAIANLILPEMTKPHIRQQWLLLAAVLLLGCLPTGGQQLQPFFLPTQQQLPVAQVHAITQSRDGMMWYATSDGLCRDNGYQIDVFKSGVNDGGQMRSNDIRCLLATNDRLVFGTAKGACALNLYTCQIESIALPKRADGRCQALIESVDKCLWLLTEHAVVRLSPDLLAIDTYYEEGCDGGNLFEDQGFVWLLQWNGGLKVWSPKDHHFRPRPWTGPCPTVMCMTGRKGEYWIGTWGQGIVRYDARSGAVTPQPAAPADADSRRITSLLADSRFGLLWATTMDGIAAYRLRDGRLERAEPSGALPQGKLIVDGLFKDNHDDLWVAGCSPTTFIIAPEMSHVVRMTVPAMRQATGFGLLADRMVADDGWWWIWQKRTGLMLYREGTAPITTASSVAGPLSPDIQRCAVGPGVLAYSGDRVFHLWHEGASIHNRLLATVWGRTVTGLRQDGFGRVWIGTTSGIHIFSAVGGNLWRLNSGRVTMMGDIAGDGQSCWYADGTRVCRVTLKGETASLSLGEEIDAMAAGDSGRVWVATRNGHVYNCDTGSFVHHREMDNAGGNRFNDIAVDKTGCVWTLTDQVVSRFQPRTMVRMRWAANDPEVAVDYFNALEPEEQGMGVAAAGAYCLFPTPSRWSVPHAQAVPSVTSVATADSTYFLGMGRPWVQLPPTASSLVLSLATAEHLFARKVSFAYRIGKDGTWTMLEQGRNLAYLNRLSKGIYDIYVKATDRYGNWGEERLCLTLEQWPEWYNTWWARLIYVFLGAAVVVGLVLLYRRIRYLRLLMQWRDETNLEQVGLEPDDVSDTRYDAAFTRLLVGTIETHLGDPGYNVVSLASDMSVSRASLFRKTKAMTGKNPTALIKEIRLKKAAALLLENQQASVADIAAKVGFATPGYFTKCFKDMFGMLPSQYRSQRHGDAGAAKGSE